MSSAVNEPFLNNSEILVNYINVLIANNNVSEAKNLIKTLKEKFQENKRNCNTVHHIREEENTLENICKSYL